MREIKVSKKFQSDWDNISVYIQENFGITYAIQIHFELERLFNTLSEFPEIGRKSFVNPMRRTFTFRQSVLVYIFSYEKIIFSRVFDSRNILNKRRL